METVITSEQDIRSHEQSLPSDVVMVHFKLIGIGPNTLLRADYNGSKICDIVNEQPGFFVVSRHGVGLREAMHDLVDRFCNAQEENNESKNS